MKVSRYSVEVVVIALGIFCTVVLQKSANAVNDFPARELTPKASAALRQYIQPTRLVKQLEQKAGNLRHLSRDEVLAVATQWDQMLENGRLTACPSDCVGDTSGDGVKAQILRQRLFLTALLADDADSQLRAGDQAAAAESLRLAFSVSRALRTSDLRSHILSLGETNRLLSRFGKALATLPTKERLAILAYLPSRSDYKSLAKEIQEWPSITGTDEDPATGTLFAKVSALVGEGQYSRECFDALHEVVKDVKNAQMNWIFVSRLGWMHLGEIIEKTNAIRAGKFPKDKFADYRALLSQSVTR